MRDWNKGNEIGSIYLIETQEDINRMGHSWMEGRLKIGDFILCTEHSGDCFNEYVLINLFYNGLNAVLASKFGAYSLGKKTKWQPTSREFHLLLAGEDVRNGMNEHPLNKEIGE
jgi:hypothetical protein